MSGPAPLRVVFDCSVFARALISPAGPAGACLNAAQRGEIKIFISDYVIQEIRELPSKIRPKLGVTTERVERLIQDLGKYGEPRQNIPELFVHPRDPDDSHYVNLAATTNSALILTRDDHLLQLMDVTTPLGLDFQRRFPGLRVITPEQFLMERRKPGVE